MLNALTKAFRLIVPDFNTRFLNKLAPMVDDVNDLESRYEEYSDAQLRGMTDEFRNRLEAGESLDDILVEAFAVVREAGKRVLGMRHYDVQLIGGYVLHKGMIAEMKTGEGKTLVATLPLYLNALQGKGAHLVTVNDYLARRDSEWMGKLYGFLGLTTGLIVHDLNAQQRRQAYHSDITYGTNNEFGFDYLRDNMAIYKEELSQRPLHYCIIDEVDSILVDEARTPLIISGPADTASEDYQKFAQIVQRLKPDRDYTVDEKAHSVIATEEGIAEVERLCSKAYGMEIDNLYAPEHMKKVHYLSAALKAKELYKRDVHYMVVENEVHIVDEFTGRLMEGRRWSDGIHQSVEAKEGVPIVRENQTLGSITYQNLFRMYNKLSGMTGTAKTEAKEFGEIYKLDVIEIPTNKPVIRKDMPDLIFRNEKEKYDAIVEHLEELHERGQPALVGTIAIETSEYLSQLLSKAKVPHEVLNAKHHAREAQIVAQAGRKGAITIATNMAGRGTDIMLGGNPEALAQDEVGSPPVFRPPAEVLELRPFWGSVRQRLDPDNFDELEGDARESALVEACKETESDFRHAAEEHGLEYQGPYADDLQQLFDVYETAYQAWKLELKAYEAKFEQSLAKYKDQCDAEKKEVLELGGLFILGTERHDSRRIDNQLRGRSGRQGDPGASQFYISMEDKLMRLFGGEKIGGMIERLGWEEGEALEHDWINSAVERSQSKVEAFHFDMRKNVLKYDDVMNDQRTFIYSQRKEALEQDDLAKHIRVMFEDVIENLMESYCNPNEVEDNWDFDNLALSLHEIFTLEITPKELSSFERSEMKEVLNERIQAIYDKREEEISAEILRRIERVVLLQVVDEQWKDHLYAMDGLQEGIGFQGYAGKNPLVEYKIAATRTFTEMIERVRSLVSQYLFRLEFEKPQAAATLEEGMKQDHEDRELFYGGGDPEAEAPDPARKAAPKASGGGKKKKKIGRNSPCPCGSGKKYKKCCG